jgi:DNA-binding NtrC family response regulator
MTATLKRETILVVDDAPATVEAIQRNLAAAGYEVLTANSVSEALHILERSPVELVVTDLAMPRTGGMDLVRHVCENLKGTGIMVITGYPSIEGAVTAVKIGAEEYLAKPFTDGELLAAVHRVLTKLQTRRLGNAAGPAVPAPQGLLGESAPMRKVFRSIAKAASAPATVLILGESGTGKELLARAIHYSSRRSAAPLLPVNCGGIPEGLLESELFGYVKGAFTGAVESRAGFFQAADGGTIFLDEIAETSLAMQVKLLRVLEDQQVYMVGSNRPRKVDVRILAATNKDLPALIKAGRFREDLFYRLNVVTISLPPLRERGNDILLLAHHFAAKFARELGKPAPVFSDGVLRILSGYPWPGNVRELENVIQSLLVMAEGDRIEPADLPATMRFSVSRQPDFTRTLADVEADYVRGVLAHVGGNRTKASKVLGIDRKTLREKLKDPVEAAGA